MIDCQIVNEQTALQPNTDRLRSAVTQVIQEAGIPSAQVSIALVDDRAISELNEHWLRHVGPTDVLSFTLESRPGYIEGEIIASGDTAAREARHFGWDADDELLLYVVHGALHLVGYDDQTPELQAVMRQRERQILAHFQLQPPYWEA